MQPTDQATLTDHERTQAVRLAEHLLADYLQHNTYGNLCVTVPACAAGAPMAVWQALCAALYAPQGGGANPNTGGFTDYPLNDWVALSPWDRHHIRIDKLRAIVKYLLTTEKE